MSSWRFAGGFLAWWLVSSSASAGAGAPPESAPASAAAADASSEEGLDALLEGASPVAGATRFPAPRADAPSTIAVLTREELDLHGFTTLGEALHFLPGLFVEAEPRRLRLVSRGLPDSMLFVYDSVPVISDAARLDVPLEDELDLGKLSRIEIVRGPGSAAWGRNAFGGVVSLVPLTGAEIGGARAALSVGSFSTRHVSVVAGDRFGDLDLAGSFSFRTGFEPTVVYRGTPTEYAFPLPGLRIPGAFRDLPGANAPDASLEATARAAWRGVSLSARWERHADFGQLASFSHAVLPRDANELRGGSSFLVRALLEQPLGGRADLTALAFFTTRAVDEIERLYPFSPRDTPFGGAVETNGSTWTAGAHLILDWRLVYGLAATAGLQADTSRSALDAAFTDPVSGEVTEAGVTRRAESGAGAAWALLRWTPPPFEALTVWAGAGLDLHSDFTPALNPRAAIVLRPGGGFTVRALYGEADRTPDQFDLIALAASAFAPMAGGVGGAAPNPNLRPERLRSGELAAEWSLPGRFRLEASGFVTHARGLVVREVDPTSDAIMARNDGARLLYGGELSARAELAEGLVLLGAAYGLVLGRDVGRDATMPDTSTPARDAPVHEGTATFGLRPMPELTLALDAGLVGPRPLRDGSGAVLPAELTFDAHVALRVPAAHLRFELRARNLTGAETLSRNEGVANRAPTVNLPGGGMVLFTVGGEL